MRSVPISAAGPNDSWAARPRGLRSRLAARHHRAHPGWWSGAELFTEKVEPSMIWNKLCGNAYTASLWISVANALKGLDHGERIAAFSYGSGFGAELLSLVAGPRAKEGAWAEDVERDLRARDLLDAETYSQLRMAPA